MKTALFPCLCALFMAITPGFCQIRSEPWQRPYTDKDATGAHVIAYWRFEPGAETEDSSKHGHDLKLNGAVWSKEGRFGGGLIPSEGAPRKDTRHAALAAKQADLSPKGAFSVEMWIKPHAKLAPDEKSFLLDKKYASDCDYQLILSAGAKSHQRHLTVSLGFGDSSEAYNSEPLTFAPGVWTHVAFAYTGDGEVRFYRNGAGAGTVRKEGRGPVTPGKSQVSIGDRLGSYYSSFAGVIDEVRICNGALDFSPIAFAFKAERAAYRRMEQSASVTVAVKNLQPAPIKNAKLILSGEGMEDSVQPLAEMAPNATHEVIHALDTSLQAGAYELKARVEIPGDPSFSIADTFAYHIAPRPLPYRMPVLMWGVYSPASVMKEMGRLKDLGFTHCLGVGADYGAVWKAGANALPSVEDKTDDAKHMLDLALVNDLAIVARLSPGSWLAGRKEFLRIGRNGEAPARDNICCLFPEVAPFFENAGKSVAQAYGKFPALQGALIDTEIRDRAQVCFHPHDREAYRKFSGHDIPAEVISKGGLHYSKIKDFPANRVIPDNHPLLQYYRWFWITGDGWNDAHSAVHRGLKTINRPDFWTFHDPAVRCPSIPGSGGTVDFLSQWTYSYPDPIRIALPTDELFTMAGFAPQKQGVMKMTQIIWYRSQTAPIATNATAAGPASIWEDHEPGAQFITIAPIHLREAFWTKMARPIQGIMYHGWQSLVPTVSTSGYRYTHPDTQLELQRLVREVVEPLGPALMQVPDRKADIAYLESFTAQMFSQRGTYGWAKGWGGDAYLALHYAHLQPEVIYDDTILQRGLDGFRVLFMMDCEVLTEALARKVREFQQQGGLIVGDDHLCPAIKADVMIESYSRTGKADADRIALLEKAALLRTKLDARYTRHLDCSNPNIVTRVRQYGTSEYVFVVNDLREYGDYVGSYDRVMENGLPSEGRLALSRPAGHVYDLLAQRELGTRISNGQLAWPLQLGPGEGRVFLVSEKPFQEINITLPATGRPGQRIPCHINVTDSTGAPVSAVVPVQVAITDPAGRPAEFSGHYGARDGKLELNLDLAPNDRPGIWQVRVRELASGRSASGYFRLVK